MSNKIDVIATDHAPHMARKNQTYRAHHQGDIDSAQFSGDVGILSQGKISLEQIVEKMSHAVAVCYKIQQRGFIREGYCGFGRCRFKFSWQWVQ